MHTIYAQQFLGLVGVSFLYVAYAYDASDCEDFSSAEHRHDV